MVIKNLLNIFLIKIKFQRLDIRDQNKNLTDYTNKIKYIT